MKPPNGGRSHSSRIALLVLTLLATNYLSAGVRVVAVDQLGYLPKGAKYVFSALPAAGFSVLDLSTGGTTFSGAMSLWKSSDAATGLSVYRGEFSSFQRAGRYRIVTTNGDSSSIFQISDSVYDPAYRKALKGFYFQRCGMQLTVPFAGVYQHTSCHPFDGFFHSTSDSAGRFHFAFGGWHDAGDYGKYVVNAGISVGTLLLAYEMFPSRCAMDNLGIPESGNGIPDILDEARYEIRWFLKMQRSDGAFWFKVTPKQFEGFVMPQDDNSSRYIYQVSTTATGDAAAVLAMAARLFAPFDSVFARQCLDAATLAWQFLAGHQTIIPAGGFKNPSDTYTGEYGDGNDSDERLWASAELFETTGDQTYNSYFLNQYVFASLFGGAMWWGDVRSLALLTYLRSVQLNADGNVQAALRVALNSYCASQVAKRNSSGYHVVLAPGDYNWGSNSGALNAAVLLLAGFAELGDTTYENAAADQLHYVLGVNGFARSYVTGLGENPPRQPHHRPSASDGVAEPVPGLLVGGPNQFGGDPVLQAIIIGGAAPALCYVDSTPSYASNEIAINWNAPLVFVTAYFRGSGGASDVGGYEKELPAGIFLGQNYPNPFNGVTNFGFRVSEVGPVRLRVFDILGREVATVVDEVKLPGEYSVRWDSGGLSSGVYFYSISGVYGAPARKMVLLK
jgi:endoglucanase